MIDRRGERFESGIVIRPEVPLARLAVHFTGVPLYDEYRLIFWRGKMIVSAAYNDIEGMATEDDFAKFANLGERIASDYSVADVARTESGDLILIEINDGGTSGLPPTLHLIEFYSAVAEEGDDSDDDQSEE
jgi:hypothetical protein